MSSTTRVRLLTVGCIAGILVVGLALRGWTIGSVFGALYADEAYAGLQSIGVVRDGRFPVVIDGSVYSAAIEAYVFGPPLALAGGSVAVLKWLFVCVWAVAAAASFGATRRLAGRRAAAIAGALTWLAPGGLLVLSTRAYMGYALGLAVAAATVWAAAVVADQATPSPRSSAVLGFLAGLAFYIHPMWVTVLAPVAMVVAFVHRRDWKRWWVPAIGAALAANLPFLLWNALNGWPSLHSQWYPPGTYSDRITGFATGLLPRAFGLRGFDGEWVFGKPLGLLLYAAIMVGIVAGCVVLVRAHRRPSRWLVPAGLLGCLPLMALLPHLIYVADARYAIIPFPLMMIALGAALGKAIAGVKPRLALAAVAAVALLWVAVTIVPFMKQQDGFTSADPNAWQERVIARLDEVGISHLAGDYGLVLPVEYRSDRAIRTAVAGNPYVIRFPLSQRIVGSVPAEQVAFLFPPGSPEPVWFYLPVDEYRQEDLGGVILYLPPAAGA